MLTLEKCKIIIEEYTEDKDEYANFYINQNDILIAMTGATIGKNAVFNRTENVLLNQRVGIMRQRNKDID